MPRTPCEQLDRSLLQLCATKVLALCMVVCSMSTAYSFSVGPLPGLNCDPGAPVPIPCDLATVLPQYQEVHQLITFDALTKVGFTPPSGPLVKFRLRALDEIEDGNALTDYNQGNHSWHFDNAYLKQGGERLIKGKQSVLDKLRNPSTMTVTQAKDLRLVFGSYLHTLQDFYAHSNYTNLADPPGIQLGDSVPPTQPPSSFPCLLLSTTSLSGAGQRNLLTTGYAIPPLDAADAPIGQCAHGLVQLGIHKDWNGRAGHTEAYESAVAASIRFADSIINDPSNNPNNVCMFMSGEPCQKSTFTCPDAITTASAVTGSTGTNFNEGKGLIQVSASSNLASAIAQGDGRSGSVSANASWQNFTGDYGQARITSFSPVTIVSPGKSSGTAGTAVISVQGNATANISACNPEVGSTANGSSSATIYFDSGFVGFEGRAFCPQIEPPPVPTSATVNFVYGSPISLRMVLAASSLTGNGQLLGAPSGSSSASASLSYTITVQNDPGAVVCQ